jgi:hypothetical protein
MLKPGNIIKRIDTKPIKFAPKQGEDDSDTKFAYFYLDQKVIENIKRLLWDLKVYNDKERLDKEYLLMRAYAQICERVFDLRTWALNGYLDA